MDRGKDRVRLGGFRFNRKERRGGLGKEVERE